ncbi:hypothetical protein QRD43_03595 [Pelomonas sp. APW6]|uniref:Uncharacterized protein n=1 Tax=Roseateles subflavus TaxID=3053353 RepID=A0ABT7LDN3_9BURK|nr:hypothetical protein [Pelomonas sp. APW6]MDL5030980.1 hypothetical protein [Pelomonas sp. APW6]
MSPSMNERFPHPRARRLPGWPVLPARAQCPRWLGPEGLSDPAENAPGAPTPADLVLSEHLLTPVVAEADLALPHDADLRAYAAQVLAHYHGAAALAWPLAPWAEGRGARRRGGAWALSQAEPWHALTTPLRTARPAAWAALAAVRAQDAAWARAPRAALAWVESNLLCWMTLEAGVLQTVRHLRLAAATPEALYARLQPLCAALPAEADVALAGYGLSAAWTGKATAALRCLTPLESAVPPALLWMPAVPAPAEARGDFLPPAQPLRRWRWPLLTVAALCLGLAAQEAWQAHTRWQSARQDLAALQARQGRPAARAARPDARPAPAEAQALLAARQALHQPWAGVLAQVERAALDEQQRPRVAWLGLDVQASRAEVRLEGLAEDRSRILAVANALAREPGWRDVLPGAIQPEEGGRPGLRFTLQARLSADQVPAVAARGEGP